MKLSYIFVISISLLVLSTTTAFSAERCFEPLSNPESKNPNQWKQLIQFKAVKPDNPSIQKVQYYGRDGVGEPVNLDYFWITVNEHPVLSMEKFFKKIRLSFPTLIFSSTDFGRFTPYPRFRVNNSMALKNQKIWEKDDPTGALMNFVMASLFMPAITGNNLLFTLEEGAVLVSCSSKTDFIFSTVYTKEKGLHPVSGNRGFGIMDAGDGKWTFYTMGADRVSQHAMAGAPLVFPAGKRIWVDLFYNIKRLYSLQNPILPKEFNSNYFKNYSQCCKF